MHIAIKELRLKYAFLPISMHYYSYDYITLLELILLYIIFYKQVTSYLLKHKN